MAASFTMRALGSAAVGAAGLGTALLAGAPLPAALVALLAGFAAAGLAWTGSDPPAPAPPRTDADTLPAPAAGDILAGIDEPLLIVRSRRILLANPAARALLGDHIEGVDVRLAIRHPAAAERLGDRDGEEGEEQITRTELTGLGQPGRRWEMATAPLPGGGRLVRLSDRSAAFASEQMRADFVANASHELRTPLATVLGFIETLQDEEAGGDPATRGRFLRIMQEEASRMRQLIDDLLSLSRIEADRFATPRDPVDLLPLAQQVEADLNGLIEARGARIEIVNAAGESVVAGDRPQLAQMLRNLVSNALKYGREGEPVTIRLDDAGAELLRLSVTDRGEGIAPEHLPRLTERFYRIDPGRSRLVGGTGLGLAIVKHIVERHRGRLDIRSRPGEGTSVRVYLPRAQDTVTKA